jgi:hypothetical protein
LSVAGAGDGVAVAWIDGQRCTGCSVPEVFLAVLGLDGRRLGETQVSVPSSTPKYFPHVVFDGQALAVAWLEWLDTTQAAVKLRRFDLSPAPVAAALDVAPVAALLSLGDIGFDAAGPGEYGVAMLVFTSTQFFTHVTCTGN